MIQENQTSFTPEEVHLYTSLYFNICMDNYLKGKYRNLDHWEYFNLARGYGRWLHESHEVVIYLKPTKEEPNPKPRYQTVPTWYVWPRYDNRNRIISQKISLADEWLNKNIEDIEKKLEKSISKGYHSITLNITDEYVPHIPRIIKVIEEKTQYKVTVDNETCIKIHADTSK